MKHRFSAWIIACVFACLSAVPAPASAQTTEPSGTDEWWTTGHLVDYGIIAGGAASYLIASRLEPRTSALVGPEYDPDDPDEIFDPEYSDRIGRTHLEEGTGETVPAAHLFVAIGAAALYLTGQEVVPLVAGTEANAFQLHETVVGFLEATALTAGTTEIAKVTAGRLRPDFQNRARRHLCSTDPPDGVGCDGFEDHPLADDPAEAEHVFADGRKSFWSGHSSHSFSMFTYTALAVGGRFVWGDGATFTSRSIGLLVQAVLIATATFVAASRLDDGRHHPTDVFTGALVGFGIANFAYWRRFDAGGNPRAREKPAGTEATANVRTGGGDVSASVVIRF